MFVFLSKFLPPFIYPLGLALFFLCAGLLLRARKRLRTIAFILALLILLLASNRFVAISLARSLEWRYLPSAEIPSAQVIVLLGGGTEPATPPRPLVELNSAGDRVLYAAFLYRQHKAPAILASGGNLAFATAPSTAQSSVSTPAREMQSLLKFMDVPADAIWLDNQSQNTYENALFCARILKEKGITRVILVTSAMHMPRSVALFKKQGIEVIPAPVDFTVTQSTWEDLNSEPFLARIVDLLPNTSSLGLTTNVMKEYFGILAYRLRGWL
jgi:uncharacterized SAM-binding protein YcdF (DUF218 family)